MIVDSRSVGDDGGTRSGPQGRAVRKRYLVLIWEPERLGVSNSRAISTKQKIEHANPTYHAVGNCSVVSTEIVEFQASVDVRPVLKKLRSARVL